ncbi:MAG: hypothetical protein PHV82_01470 [Victivallaceae bacterium]|jgi:outer membrane biosynthesis protein TonB|nr:hypothetical protein [Victivallaceae bacterium]
MIEIVLGILNAINNRNEEEKQWKCREKQCKCHPGYALLARIQKIIAHLEDDKKTIDFHLEHFKAMHEMISGMIEEDEKQEQAPGGTDSATKKTEATQAQEQKTSDKPQEPGNNTPETPTPVPKHGRKPKEKAKPEYKRLPKHRATGNPRLDALETALHDALECLNNTKLAFYVKDIKEVRLALSELYKSWNKPEDERIAELKAGLKAAADKLSANSRAAKSKIMQDIWSDIIVALQNKNSE